ncbi:MAG TPA: AI-2E family transporter [Ktedonobacterales bacterium]|nr:AI-2E family transporter [Ktedonobacterales bacterium]
MNGKSALDTEVTNTTPVTPDDRRALRWARQRDIVLTIIGWLFVVAVILWAASHIARSLLVLLIAVLLAYALAPVVTFLRRFMPRWLAILVVYLVVVALLAGLIYLIVTSLISQLVSLTHTIAQLSKPGGNSALNAMLATLHQYGVSDSQLLSARQQLLSQLEGLAQNAIPLLTGIFSGALDAILVVVLSVYLLIDGERLIAWLKANAPLSYRSRVRFTFNTLQRVVGGYIRGQLLLCTLVGVLVGAGMAVFQVPYALLLGVLAFVFEFIPIIGVFFSGAFCVVLALVSHGPLIAGLVLVYFIIVHIIEGDVVGPRIVGQAVGVHPAVSIFALLAGAELFGVWGALLASPVAGVLQVFLTAVFRQWRMANAQQFPEEFGPTIVPVTTAQAQVASGASPGVAPTATAVTVSPALGDATAEASAANTGEPDAPKEAAPAPDPPE